MAQAFRSEKFKTFRWKDDVEFLTKGGAASIPNQCCPKCGASYTVLVKVGDDQDYCLDRFKNRLSNECPEHCGHYKICEGRLPLPHEEVVGED